MKKLAKTLGALTAVVLTVAVYLPTQASALTVQQNWGGVSAGFTDTFAMSHFGTGVAIEDLWVFTPDAGLYGLASTVNIPLPGDGSAYDIADLAANIVETAGLTPVGSSVVGANGDIQMTAILTGGTEYAILVEGTTSGSIGGFYGGEILLEPVPIPGAAWLLGSGLLGLLSVSRARRKGSVAAV